MISWISGLCVLCAISALIQMTLEEGAGRDSLRVLCGMSMLHMTLTSVREIAAQLAACTGLEQVFACLMR